MTMAHRVLLAAGLSWIFSATLALVFACVAFMGETGGVSLRPLFLPGVASVALFSATVVAIAMTPVVVWSVRTGEKNMWLYGPVFWLILVLYILLVIPRTGAYGPYGLFVLAVAGAIAIGFIPPAR